ncbi:MAG: hypothetical protein IT371_04135 [Deltaproteobacteria bacterium]|nr:hypothetical protein [Deltaproteobacteria bacterium]
MTPIPRGRRGLLVATMFLAACGGGGGSTDAAPSGDGTAREAGPDGVGPGLDGGLPLPAYTWCTPHGTSCQAGLKCLGRMCQPLCDAAKGRANNPGCPDPARYVCDGKAWAPLAVCRRRCDPAQGRGTNPECPVGTYCQAGTPASESYCSVSPAPPTRGPRRAGESCVRIAPAARTCGAGLFCSGDPALPVCVKACDPRRGAKGNPLCDAGEECVEDAASYAQGKCLPPASRGADQVCNDTSLRCTPPLACSGGRCQHPCDAKKGVTANPDCAVKESFCVTIGSASLCRRRCDRAQGGVAHPACAEGYYCAAETGPYAPGQCLPLAAAREGPVARGGRCGDQLDLRCKSGLVCLTRRCAASCNPRLAPPGGCGDGEVCEERTNVPTGGVCVPSKGTVALGLPCDRVHAPCAAGLVCDRICHRACDPKKGDNNNPDCADLAKTSCVAEGTGGVCRRRCSATQPAALSPDCALGTYCHGASGTSPGLCRPSPTPPLGRVQTASAPCTTATYDDDCDGEKGLVCLMGGPSLSAVSRDRCALACDPRAGAAATCGAGEVCTEYLDSPKQGACVRESGQPRGERCNLTDKRCSTGLLCYLGECLQACDTAKGGAETNPACPAPTTDYTCVELKRATIPVDAMACRKKCDPAKGTLTSPECPAGTFCQADAALGPTVAYCRPTLEPPRGGAALGASCSPLTDDCDGSKSQVCADRSSYTCEPACDPRTQGAPCATGEVCLPSTQSFLGGYCL